MHSYVAIVYVENLLVYGKNNIIIFWVKKMILSDIAIIFDCPHSTAPDEGDGYPLIRTPNVGKGRLLLDGVHRVCEETYRIRNKRATPRENDIIFAREAPAGNAAVITKDQYVCLGQRTVLIRPNNRTGCRESASLPLRASARYSLLIRLSAGVRFGFPSSRVSQDQG